MSLKMYRLGTFSGIYFSGIVFSLVVPFAVVTNLDRNSKTYVVESCALTVSIFFPMFNTYIHSEYFDSDANTLLFMQFTYTSVFAIFILWVTAYEYSGLLIVGFVIGIVITIILLAVLGQQINLECLPDINHYLPRKRENEKNEVTCSHADNVSGFYIAHI